MKYAHGRRKTHAWTRRSSLKAEGAAVMKHLQACILLRALFLKFILVEAVCLATGWIPVLAGEGNAPIGLSTAIRRVAEQNRPAVVHIEVTQGQKVTNPFLPFENDPSLRFFSQVPRMSWEFKEGLKRMGTGMFIDSEGHIITSYHLVGGATGDRCKEISDSGTLQNEVTLSPIGQEVNMNVFRKGEEQTLTVRVGDPQKMITEQVSSIENRLGVKVRPMTSREVKRYGLDSKKGLVIISVYPDSPLAGFGFEANDMMLEINGRSIDGLADLLGLINSIRPQQRIILLGRDHRSGRSGYVQLVLP